jgi:Lactate dehydrogenase and related dehydrogenases
MKIAFFDTKDYDRHYFDEENVKYNHEIKYFEPRLNENTAALAKGFDAVCPFVNANVDAATIHRLKEENVRLIALRSAGFNHVDIDAAKEAGITVVRVPAYSPHAVAEGAFAMLLTLIRKLQHAYVRTREFNFSLSGLVGFDLFGKTIGIVGTGKIGRCAIDIAKGFGLKVLAYDPYPAEIEGVEFVSFERLARESDIISLHCPLTRDNHHLINRDSIGLMKKGVILVNTSRGALVESNALLEGLKSRKIGAAALDVYEEEAGIFFSDLSENGISNDTLALLISMPNVLVTSHQGYLTEEALSQIAAVTLKNVMLFEEGKDNPNTVI